MMDCDSQDMVQVPLPLSLIQDVPSSRLRWKFTTVGCRQVFSSGMDKLLCMHFGKPT